MTYLWINVFKPYLHVSCDPPTAASQVKCFNTVVPQCFNTVWHVKNSVKKLYKPFCKGYWATKGWKPGETFQAANLLIAYVFTHANPFLKGVICEEDLPAPTLSQGCVGCLADTLFQRFAFNLKKVFTLLQECLPTPFCYLPIPFTKVQQQSLVFQTQFFPQGFLRCLAPPLPIPLSRFPFAKGIYVYPFSKESLENHTILFEPHCSSQSQTSSRNLVVKSMLSRNKY